MESGEWRVEIGDAPPTVPCAPVHRTVQYYVQTLLRKKTETHTRYQVLTNTVPGSSARYYQESMYHTVHV